MTGSTLDPVLLARLADVAVRVGLNLHPGQDLVLTAPVEALPLVRKIAAGAIGSARVSDACAMPW